MVRSGGNLTRTKPRPLTPFLDMTAEKQALWERVKSQLIPTNGGCWEWPGAKQEQGYGFVSFQGKMVRVHRLALEWRLGRPLKSMALHTCDNPSCANPFHLFEGTANDNRKDAIAKGRSVFGLPNTTSGESHARAKLTNKDVLFIRNQHSAKKQGTTELAIQFGVRDSAISKIIQRQRWRHI